MDLLIKFYVKICVSALEVFTFSENNSVSYAIVAVVVGLFIGQCLMVCMFSGALFFFFLIPSVFMPVCDLMTETINIDRCVSVCTSGHRVTVVGS